MRSHIPAVRELAKIREARIRRALRDQFRNGHVFRCDEVFMLEMLDRGLIGMDGFKFCEVEEAKQNRELMLIQLGKGSGNSGAVRY